MSKTIFMIHENGNATLQEDSNVIREVGALSGLFEAMADFNKMMKKRNLSYRLTSSYTELLTGCGLKDNIAIVGLHISPTYRGLLCGMPDEEMNKEYIAESEQRAVKQFGSPVYVVQPKIMLNPVELEGGRIFQSPRLPSYTILASLETFEIEGDFDGRMLTIVLFVDDIYSMPIDQIIGSSILELDWKKHSQLWSCKDF